MVVYITKHIETCLFAVLGGGNLAVQHCKTCLSVLHTKMSQYGLVCVLGEFWCAILMGLICMRC